jgi:hypothetical protein
VAEASLDQLRVRSGGDSEAGGRVPEVVEPEACLVGEGGEDCRPEVMPVEGAVSERGSVRGRGDERVEACTAGGGRGLADVSLEHLREEARDADRPRLVGLGRAEVKDSVDLLERAVDVEGVE